ncbi:MAG TPA: DUF1572 family protein [Gemmatimonadaceae bacterium]
MDSTTEDRGGLAQDLSILRDSLHVILLRDLRAVERQIAAYPDDASLWKTAPGISNSGGTLVLHIAGNLRHFIATVLAGGKYVRDRDAEFSARGMTRADLAAEIRAAISELDDAIPRIDSAQLAKVYPTPVRERRIRTADFLVHLAVHLGYHLGQLDYHRRLLTENPQAVDTLSPGELLETPG